MASFNRVILLGNVTRDLELRYIPSGTAVCEFGLAVNRTYTTSGGEQRDETCFVDVKMWGRRGVVISEYFTKGRQIFIEGRLEFDSWETPEGRRSRLRVVAENFEFIGPRSSGGGGGGRGSGGGGGRSGQAQDRRPAQEQQPQQPQEAPDEGLDVADDEIPF